MRMLFVAATTIMAIPVFANAMESHSLFTAILQDHVEDGVVNYGDLRSDARLGAYLDQLSAAAPESLANDDDKLAFWINAYNAFTLKIVCDNYPIESINELHFVNRYVGWLLKKMVWDKKFIEIAGKRISLNHIEHEIIRKEFKEPRAHFALVCASKSCPPLRSEAFEGSELDAQLQDQGRAFFADSKRNRVDSERKTVHLSAIFSWFKKDFGRTDRDILEFAAQFLSESTARAILSNPGAWTVEHLDYDWSLNGF